MIQKLNSHELETVTQVKQDMLHALGKGNLVIRRFILDGFLKMISFDAVQDPSNLIANVLINFQLEEECDTQEILQHSMGLFFKKYAMKSPLNCKILLKSLCMTTEVLLSVEDNRDNLPTDKISECEILDPLMIQNPSMEKCI